MQVSVMRAPVGLMGMSRWGTRRGCADPGSASDCSSQDSWERVGESGAAGGEPSAAPPELLPLKPWRADQVPDACILPRVDMGGPAGILRTENPWEPVLPFQGILCPLLPIPPHLTPSTS